MNPDVKAQWVAALRSGEYAQGKYVLHNVDENTFCCLGVLCDLAVKAGVDVLREDGEHWEYSGETSSRWNVRAYDKNAYGTPDSVMAWAGLEEEIPETTVISDEDDEPMHVAALNDHGWPFYRIADVIERDL